MKIITRQSLAATAAERWNDQYYVRKNHVWYNEDRRLVYSRLVDLGKTPDPDEVDQIIGNGSWTHISCNNCEQQKDPVVSLVGVAADEYGDSLLCRDCITEAAELFGEDVF